MTTAEDTTPVGEAVRIIKTVAEFYDLEITKMLSQRRDQPIARHRQLAMYLCRQLTDLTLTAVGDLFGRHHTTVMNAEKITEGSLWRNEDNLRGDVETILIQLGKQ